MEEKQQADDDEAIQGQSARVDGRGCFWSRRWEVGINLTPQHMAMLPSIGAMKITSELSTPRRTDDL
jgi:hypothetical protein